MTKTNTVKTALAAVTLAAAAFALPTVANAGNYKCSDTENAVAGAAIGGSLGTILGEEIAGRGDKTEGAVLGAVVGGILGAAIGDGASDCEKDKRRNTRYTPQNRYPATTTYRNRGAVIQTVGHNGRHNSYGHRGHRNYGYNRGYRQDPVAQINREIEQLRRERARLKDERRYSRGYRPRLEARLDRIARRLDRLKRERKQLKRYDTRRNDYYQPQTRRGHYHGNSRNLCYSGH